MMIGAGVPTIKGAGAGATPGVTAATAVPPTTASGVLQLMSAPPSSKSSVNDENSQNLPADTIALSASSAPLEPH